VITIGLTGGIGCGKSTAANIFQEFNIPIIDADVIAHDIVEPGQPTLDIILQTFGQHLKRPDDTLNRAVLRDLIFKNPDKRHQLEAIMHPVISKQMIEIRSTLDTPYCLMVIPLLIEAKQENMVDRLLVIDCSEASQKQRVLKRPGMSDSQLQQILEAQATRQERLSAADDIVQNDGDIASLRKQILNLHIQYLQLNAAS